jgi:hypothetical protein
LYFDSRLRSARPTAAAGGVVCLDPNQYRQPTSWFDYWGRFNDRRTWNLDTTTNLDATITTGKGATITIVTTRTAITGNSKPAFASFSNANLAMAAILSRNVPAKDLNSTQSSTRQIPLQVSISGVQIPAYGSAASYFLVNSTGTLSPGKKCWFNVQQFVGGSTYVVKIAANLANPDNNPLDSYDEGDDTGVASTLPLWIQPHFDAARKLLGRRDLDSD